MVFVLGKGRDWSDVGLQAKFPNAVLCMISSPPNHRMVIYIVFYYER